MSKKVHSGWYVWVTAVTQAYAELLVGKLVSRGWTIGSVTASGALTYRATESSPTLIAFQMAKEFEKPPTSTEVITELTDTMKLMNMTWLSIVVSNPLLNTYGWIAGQIDPPSPNEEIPEDRIIH